MNFCKNFTLSTPSIKKMEELIIVFVFILYMKKIEITWQGKAVPQLRLPPTRHTTSKTWKNLSRIELESKKMEAIKR